MRNKPKRAHRPNLTHPCACGSHQDTVVSHWYIRDAVDFLARHVIG